MFQNGRTVERSNEPCSPSGGGGGGGDDDSEKCSGLIFVTSPCEKVIIVQDTNYMRSSIGKFMFDMPSAGSFQNIGLST